MDNDRASIATGMDGKASIEHQIDIHLLDLAQIESIPEFALSDILQGLNYVMEYRVKGLKMRNLDLELMRRLLKSLLQTMGGKEGKSLLRQHPTKEADMSFHLFAEFLMEVEEFREAVSEVSVTDLRHSLKLHRRCRPSRSSSEDKAFVAEILGLLTRTFPRFSDVCIHCS